MTFFAHINKTKKQTCREHCENTARYAGENLKTVGLSSAASLSGLLHDCGKFTSEFSNYIEKNASGAAVKKGSVIHTFAGCYLLFEKYHKCSDEIGWKEITAELLSYAISSHHGLFDIIDQSGKDGFHHRLIKQPAYEHKAISAFYEECATEEEIDCLFLKAEKEIRSFVEKIIGFSGGEQGDCLFYLGMLARLITSAVIDGDRRDTAEFMGSSTFSEISRADNLFWQSAVQSVNKLIEGCATQTIIQHARAELSQKCFSFAQNNTGIYRLNLPTGAGKTLSSLRFAVEHARIYGKKRIIYTAPLISILEQNSAVIKSAIKNDRAILEHHSNVVINTDDQEELSRNEFLAQTWDSPIIITTLVQLLNTLFEGRTTSVRRFHSLCDSIIIIDEVQSVPNKMLSMFNLAMNFLSMACNCTILLCSATQPCLEELPHAIQLSEQVLLSESEYNEYKDIFRRTDITDWGNLNFEEIIIKLKELLSDTQSLLIVCNTKNEATRIYSALKGPHANFYHLSASMCMAHREKIIKRVNDDLKNNRKTICVSTQVIEAGVDISFSKVVRFNAGLDNIVQSAGRCNRNNEMGHISPVYIVQCADETLFGLNEIKQAQDATNELLCEFKNNPERFNKDLASDEAVKYYYKCLYRELENCRGCLDYPLKDMPTMYSLLSDNEEYRSGCGDAGQKLCLVQAFKTAGDYFKVFDSDSYTVIVPYEEGRDLITGINSSEAMNNISHAMELIEETKKYTVSMFEFQFRQLEKAGALYNVGKNTAIALKPEYYDNNIGLILRPGEEEDDICNTLIL